MMIEVELSIWFFEEAVFNKLSQLVSPGAI